MNITKWIGSPAGGDICLAPLFRREFNIDGDIKHAQVKICGLGYYEMSLNGYKVGDHVLDPIVTQYDQRARYVVYDLTSEIVRGNNAIVVMLGTGWYDCHTMEVWDFNTAGWRDKPKLWMELEVELQNGEILSICTDTSWKTGDGPIRFDGLRNGETYDAREERFGWDSPGFDDSSWALAVVVPGPGGILQEQTSPPCKVMDTIMPVSINEIRDGVAVFDIGQSIAGWVQLQIKGNAGTEIVLRYGELLKENGEVDQKHIGQFIKSGEFQTDRYIMKGEDIEIWEPRFTYHGFRYVQVEGLPEKATLNQLRGRVVHTSFEKIGSFECSDEDINRLQAATEWSYIGNFVGIPTDCPHREKNGWTGDAQLAAETGLMNYDASSSYRQWLETMADTQRPSGQFPGIVPSAGWGYNWGSGPAWDAAFILIPWYIYLYTGDKTAIEQHYDSIKRYVDYCTCMATEHIVSFGLGDWCTVDKDRMAPAELTSTAYYYIFANKLADFAELMGNDQDTVIYRDLAGNIRKAFNTHFYKGDGVYANGEMTSLGCALYQGLVDERERAIVVQRLVEIVVANDAKVDFGILGAKYVPRALADNGHVDLAYRMITQPEFPGWVNWLRSGATTLWENWNGEESQNHIMFGDISAWFYSYLGGIQPDPEKPGLKHVIIAPQMLAELDWVKAQHRSPYGLVEVNWTRSGGNSLNIMLPDGVTATLKLEGKPLQELRCGKHNIVFG